MPRRREPETARIESVTPDGRGVAAGTGKRVLIAGALDGETVKFLRRRSRRKFDEAELLEVLDASPQRIAARCAVFGRCGGCALQHVSDTQQRAMKFQTLKDSLERIGRVQPARWLEPIVGPAWNYRRRARLAVKDVPGKGRVLVGFRERLAPFVTDMHRCEILAKPVDALFDPLSELIGALSIQARLPQIEVAVADNATALVFRVLDTPSADDTAKLRAFAEAQGIRLYLQPGGLDTVALLYPDDPIEPLYYSLSEFDVRIAFEPHGFVQVNGVINERMVAAAIDLLEPAPDDRVLDLYCGIGNFSLPLAQRAGSVVGIDVDAALVRAAEENARRNNVGNASFRVADLDAIEGNEQALVGDWDRVLLDPARDGAAAIVHGIGALAPRRIVYVSCHPGTLARDAGTLVAAAGYRLDAAGIIDMFPHTSHVESVAVFSK